MKKSDWKDVAELIGIAAIVASLIFVGLQMKQADTIAMSGIYQERALSVRENVTATAANPFFVNGTAKLYVGKQDALSAQEAIALEYEFYGLLMAIDNYMLQRDLGFLPDGQWTAIVADLRCQLEHPFYANAVEGLYFRDEMQSMIDGLLQQAELEPTKCWDFEYEYALEE